jgi:hypothetical protein
MLPWDWDTGSDGGDMKKVLSVLVLVTLLTLHLSAQVFPERETLDVVRISDGSVLRGKIIENFVDRYVTIEIYGGSIFTVAYENIEAIEEEPNPDYNMQWLRIEVSPGALRDDTDGPAAEGASREKGPFLGQGHITGLYATVAWNWYTGNDWTDTLDNVDADDSGGGDFGAAGFSYTYLRQARRDVAPWWMWGLRTGIGWSNKIYRADIIDPTTGIDRAEYEFIAHILEVPVEFLIGGGGDRFVWYLGGGLGGSILLAEPDSRFDGDEVGHPSGNDADNPLQAFFRVGTGGYFRIADSWTGDIRVTYDRMFSGSWYPDFSQEYNTLSLGLGVGYHFR